MEKIHIEEIQRQILRRQDSPIVQTGSYRLSLSLN